METVAIYTEEKIRIYGISQRGPQALLTFHFKAEDFQNFVQLFEKLRLSFKKFEQFTLNPVTEQFLSAHLLLSEQVFAAGVEQLHKLLGSTDKQKLQIITPVNSLFLHGPHFHDRYGIAEAIFTAISENNIDILMCSCSGTSMYITTRPEQTQECYQLLKDTFLIPSCP